MRLRDYGALANEQQGPVVGVYSSAKTEDILANWGFDEAGDSCFLDDLKGPR